METEAGNAPSQIKPRLSGGSSSFRLRSPSLNSVRLRRIFDIFDKNHDSIITVDELGQALALLGLQTDDLSQLDSMVETYIQPGNQGLTYQDFEALHRSLNDVFFGGGFDHLGGADDDDESDLSEAFKVFDEDGDGYISASELHVVLGKLGLQEGREMDRVEMMISSVDRNHDGRVDFFEFKDMMRNVVVPSS
ncbi:calcium-binding protein cast [Phtheirospermum japonicum]|uniref:Calcium-binding protein cast n=1 Tax=Phtheirospermum japonicum TaxID=374723 RepID=A0A830BR06_9LAMI|nr:calcium-binding protein cast [Phtheirospermum japonicum]